MISALGGPPRQVAHVGICTEEPVQWSPDGKYIAALGYHEGEPAAFVVPASGGEPRRLTAPEEGNYKVALVWHPDGQRLTYVNYLDGDSELRQAYLDGRPSSLLFNQPDRWDYIGTWAPDGKHFFFKARPNVDKGPGWLLFRFDAETGAFTTVATHIGGFPSWSRDRKTVVWGVRRSASELWLIENFR